MAEVNASLSDSPWWTPVKPVWRNYEPCERAGWRTFLSESVLYCWITWHWSKQAIWLNLMYCIGYSAPTSFVLSELITLLNCIAEREIFHYTAGQNSKFPKCRLSDKHAVALGTLILTISASQTFCCSANEWCKYRWSGLIVNSMYTDSVSNCYVCTDSTLNYRIQTKGTLGNMGLDTTVSNAQNQLAWSLLSISTQ